MLPYILQKQRYPERSCDGLISLRYMALEHFIKVIICFLRLIHLENARLRTPPIGNPSSAVTLYLIETSVPRKVLLTLLT